MKKSLTKLLSSTIAFTLVLAVSGSAGTAQMSKVQAEAQPERAVSVVEEIKEEPKGTGIIEVLEEKLAAEVPVAEVVKAEAPVVEEVAAPVVEEVAAPVVELADLAKAAEVEEEVAPEVAQEEAVAEWDVSETTSDNVTMKFYAEAKNANGQVNIDTTTGEVVISGTGDMEESIYRHFLSTEKYLAATKTAFEDEYGVEVDLVYDPAITDVMELDGNIRYYVAGTDEELFVTEDMCWNMNPSDFLAFSPTVVYISEGITNVSAHAFACCADLVSVELPSTVKYIDELAFQYCTSLETVKMPENTEIRDGAFEYCASLTNIIFESPTLDNNAKSVGDGSVRALTQEEINVLTGAANR